MTEIKTTTGGSIHILIYTGQSGSPYYDETRTEELYRDTSISLVFVDPSLSLQYVRGYVRQYTKGTMTFSTRIRNRQDDSTQRGRSNVVLSGPLQSKETMGHKVL